MNQLLADIDGLAHEAFRARGEITSRPELETRHSAFDELAHELRQPLGVIESLAYFLEMSESDPQAAGHLQRIQAMVLKANDILERYAGV